MRIFSTRLRASAALLASAAGIATLGSVVAPTVASASTPASSAQALAAKIVPANQLASFNQIVSHESSWNVNATNASSGAYGLVQALPGSKMASAGADWKTNPATQIKWGLNYMNERYGSPNAAWAFWQTHHWY
ncbi:transglycosylase SLT domain-containing protein [Kitasatospora sp. NBC_00315]|uniref:aggregation-promoting factor C-terminal-like domain-containing protein n=1 Tax=Kitasatospora sp. NBC_00315 TaxID=2975963 RepID=UPI00324802C3